MKPKSIIPKLLLFIYFSINIWGQNSAVSQSTKLLRAVEDRRIVKMGPREDAVALMEQLGKGNVLGSLDSFYEMIDLIEQLKDVSNGEFNGGIGFSLPPVDEGKSSTPGIDLLGSFDIRSDGIVIEGTAGLNIPAFNFDTSFDVSLKNISNGQTPPSWEVDEFHISLESEIPLGTSELYLHALDGVVRNLNDQDNISITADIGMNLGKKIENLEMISAELSADIGLNGYFELNGEAKVLGFPADEFSLTHNPGVNCKVNGNISILPDVISADAYLNYWFEGKPNQEQGSIGEGPSPMPETLTGGTNIELKAPSDWPVIGGFTFAEDWFDGAFDIETGYARLNGGVKILWSDYNLTYYSSPQKTIKLDLGWLFGEHIIKFSDSNPSDFTVDIPEFENVNGIIKFYRSNFEQWEIPFIHLAEVPETGGLLVINKNYERLHRYSSIDRSRMRKMGGPDVIPFNIKEEYNNSKLIFRLNYQHEITGNIKLQLKQPNGLELDISEGLLPDGYLLDGQTEVAGFSAQNKDAREAYFSLASAKIGQYELIVNEPQKLGEYTIEVQRQNEKPSLDVVVASDAVNRDGTVNTGMFRIDWLGGDEDNFDVNVDFYLDTDNKIPNGIKAVSKKLDEFKEEGTFTFPTDHLGVQPGWYYVYMLMNDGLNSPTIKYSDEKIWVDMDEAPKPVEQFKCVAGDGEFTVKWVQPDDPDIYYYDIYYGKENDSEVMDIQTYVQPGYDEITITGVINDTPYLVSVLAVDIDGNTSGKKVIQRVVPRVMAGGSVPVILSTPNRNATITKPYYYQPTLFDRDSQTHIEMKIVASKSHKIRWKLLQAPDAMTIHEETGLVKWTPTRGDLGKDIGVSLLVTKSGEYSIDNGGEIIDLSNLDQTAVQSFSVHVDMVPYGSNNAGISSRPLLTAYPGTIYEYTVDYNDYVNTDEIMIELLEGPIGMDIEGNKIVWQVPEDAIGEPVKFVAETLNGKRYTQEFFLHVEPSGPAIDLKPEILAIQEKGEHFNIVFFGTAGKEYEVQVADLIRPDQTTWQAAGRYSSGSGITVYTHSSPGKKSQFFRVLQVAD